MPCWLLFLLLLPSCRPGGVGVRENLDLAERLMTDRPDSSLSILEKTDPGLRASDRSRHALLLTLAKFKNYAEDTDTLRIGKAREYYANGRNIRYRFLSLFCAGWVWGNNRNYPRAMIAYNEAESLLKDLDDDYLAGLLYSQIGDVYLKYYDYGKSLESYKVACRHYALAGKETHKAYALLDMGIACWNNRDTSMAVRFIKEALESAVRQKDALLEQACHENLVILYDEADESGKCAAAIEKLSASRKPEATSPLCFSAIAAHKACTGAYGEAEKYLEAAWSGLLSVEDSISLFFRSAWVMKRAGRPSEALRFYENGVRLESVQLRRALQEPILSVQKEYYRGQAEQRSLRLKKNRQLYLASSGVALLLLLLAAMYLRQRFLEKGRQMEKYMELADELQASVQERDRYVGEMSGRVEELFRGQYGLLDKLSKTYYETHGVGKDKERIYEQVKSEIDRFANDKRTMAALEKIVNTHRRDVMQLVRKNLPDLTERDLKLLCYLYAGFSAKSISCFTGETIGNILTRKSRLRAKMARLETPDGAVMLQELP